MNLEEISKKLSEPFHGMKIETVEGAKNPVTGATAFGTPALFVDAAGVRGAVSDGLRLHREGGTTWASTPIDVLGSKVAVARRGRFLYLAFTGAATDDSGPPTVTVVDLGP